MVKEIFVLEDDKDIGFLLNYLLFEEGYWVRVYENLSDFRKALVSGKPDLLLMDVRLPDGNGMDFCDELKGQRAFETPILMMSADWHMHNQNSCKAEEYIAKPFDLDTIVQKVDRYLRHAG